MDAGNSIFFHVKRIEDPIGLLPAKLILGINKRGVHFFRPVCALPAVADGNLALLRIAIVPHIEDIESSRFTNWLLEAHCHAMRLLWCVSLHSHR